MATGRFAARPSSTPIVYVSDLLNNVVTLYSQSDHSVVGQISAVSEPEGMRFSNGYLYVTEFSHQDVLVFAKGSTTPTPSLTLFDPGEKPEDIAIGSDGTKYVANYSTSVTKFLSA
jgi:DNA-binding beta-propeller fold protein YncE